MIVFNGVAKVITLDDSTTNITVREIYSRWKDWVLLNNAQFEEAFRVVGGDNLGGGSVAPTFYFLRTDYGWKIRLPESSIEITLDGNLVSEEAGADMISPPVGAFTPSLTINRSQVATVNLDAVWESVVNENTPGTAGYIIGRLLSLIEADEILTDSIVTKLRKGTNEVLLSKVPIQSGTTIELRDAP
jgi:hypothetical protein